MRVKIIVSTLILSIFNIALLFAQDDGAGLPCAGADDDTFNCPLDTWVFILGAIAMAFAAWHLHKQKKSSAGI